MRALPRGAGRRRPKATRADEADTLERIPNIGPSLAADLRAIGILQPRQLRDADPYALYARLERVSGRRQDPCVADTFIAAVRFMQGGPARPWWDHTAERKRHFATLGRTRR
jgi:Pathogenicity locus